MFCARVYKFEQRLNKVKDHGFTDPLLHCTVAVAPYSIPSGVKYIPLVTSGRLPQDFSKKYNYVLIFMLCTINKTKINLKIIIIIKKKPTLTIQIHGYSVKKEKKKESCTKKMSKMRITIALKI